MTPGAVEVRTLAPGDLHGAAPVRGSRAGLPHGAGIGPKPRHFQALLATRPALAFVEVHAENYMVAGGPRLAMLEALREALPVFGRKIRGYDMADAVMTGVETRTSSPVRMTRRPDHQSLSVDGLYPAGEGAGYAGGIYSAAIDGIRTAKALAENIAGAPRA